jgi:thiol-disulfide isomerase/thioredoxin
MANIYEVISEFLRPYSKRALIVVLLGIFIWAAYIGYNKWIKPKKDNVPPGIYQPVGNRDATIYFFAADWCPHCKKAKPEWSKFVSRYDGRTIGGFKITCVHVDCTNAELPEAAHMISKFNITTYPTVKMIKDNQTFEFDSKITEKNLEEFVNLTTASDSQQ